MLRERFFTLVSCLSTLSELSPLIFYRVLDQKLGLKIKYEHTQIKENCNIFQIFSLFQSGFGQNDGHSAASSVNLLTIGTYIMLIFHSVPVLSLGGFGPRFFPLKRLKLNFVKIFVVHCLTYGMIFTCIILFCVVKDRK